MQYSHILLILHRLYLVSLLPSDQPIISHASKQPPQSTMAPSLSSPGTEVTVSPVKLAHVVLKTRASQFKAMVSFYKTFLSAHAVHENEFMSFLTYDSEHHRIAIVALPNIISPPVRSASGLMHIAFTFSSLTDLALAYKQRKANGMEPYWCVNHGPTTSLYYRDPDGNEVETQVDNFEDPEEATRMMESAEFRENGIGADFDPEELCRKLESGEDEEIIKKRANVGKRGPESVPIV